MEIIFIVDDDMAKAFSLIHPERQGREDKHSQPQYPPLPRSHFSHD